MAEAVLIMIAGGHAAGKKLATELLKKSLETRFAGINIQTVDMAHFKRPEAPNDGSRDPSVFDFEAFESHLKALMDDPKVDLIIGFGLYVLYKQNLIDMSRVRIFIDTDSDVRLGRWLKRDILGAGAPTPDDPHRTNPQLKPSQAEHLKRLLHIYLDKSRVEMKKYVLPTKDTADIILPSAAEEGGIRLVVDGIDPILRKKLGQLGDGDEEASSERERLREETWENVQKSLRTSSNGPSLKSLGNDNFSSSNRRWYEMN